MGYLDLLGQPNAQLNHDFLRNHPNHWLALTHQVIHQKSARFAATSCAVTAHAALWKLGFEIEECASREFATLKEAVQNSPIVVVEANGGDHWFLAVENHIVESWWNEYEPRMFVCTDEFLEKYESKNVECFIPNKILN